MLFLFRFGINLSLGFAEKYSSIEVLYFSKLLFETLLAVTETLDTNWSKNTTIKIEIAVILIKNTLSFRRRTINLCSCVLSDLFHSLLEIVTPRRKAPFSSECFFRICSRFSRRVKFFRFFHLFKLYHKLDNFLHIY